MTPNAILAFLFALPFGLSLFLDAILGLSAQFWDGGQKDE